MKFLENEADGVVAIMGKFFVVVFADVFVVDEN